MSLARPRSSVFRARRQPALTCGLVCSLLLLLLLAACNDSPPPVAKTPSGKTPPRTQFPMPPAQKTAPQSADDSQPNSFTLMDNSRKQLSNYEGEVVVLDFYATWCPPCREETPHLVELHKRYGSQGLRIIGLNVGGPDDRDKVPEFISEYKIPYALGFPDEEMSSFYLSDDDRIPQAFVFGRTGKLVKRFVSYDERMAAELERVIKEQLAIPGGSN